MNNSDMLKKIDDKITEIEATISNYNTNYSFALEAASELKFYQFRKISDSRFYISELNQRIIIEYLKLSLWYSLRGNK